MLFKLIATNGRVDRIEPVPFQDFAQFGLERDLEDLIARNLFGVLFENDRLMPIFQERPFQAETDIYALNEAGELYIFELKLHAADEGAVHQVLRYVQDAGQWSYAQLQAKYQQYSNPANADLQSCHQEVFQLDQPLNMIQFNNKQHLVIIGNSANRGLINAVNYWQEQGISISFLPYRIYELGGEHYFEMFAWPHDQHVNPADNKGVLFDTSRNLWEDGIWYMMENGRVAAFGDGDAFVGRVHPGDIVFFWHARAGIVAAARVTGDVVYDRDNAVPEHPGYLIAYREVEFLTQTPTQNGQLMAMPADVVREVTGKEDFFWPRTIKVPYLTMAEAENLLQAFLANYAPE